MIGYLMASAIVLANAELGMEKWKEEIKAEWRKSRNYPRKKKKRVRRSLRLDWAVANYNPLDGLC